MKKRFFYLPLILFAIFTLTACRSNGDSEPQTSTPFVSNTTEVLSQDASELDSDKQTQTTIDGEHIPIAYFSRMGNTNFNESVDATTSASIKAGDNGSLGTTEVIANMIQNKMGGDIHLIQAAEPYPEDYDTAIAQAIQEKESGFKPALKSRIENIDQYDVIFIGFPVWASTIPAPVQTFLSEYDLSGKIVVPFCTHNGYGRGSSFTAVGELCPQSTMLEGLVIEAEQVDSAQSEVEEWLQTIGITEAGNGNNDVTAIETPITISIGDVVLTGALNNSPEAQKFIAMLPQTISMMRYGEYEYYGGLPSEIPMESDNKLNFEAGDITYCSTTNTAAIFFAKTDIPNNLNIQIFPIGKLTSDVSVFNDMESRVEALFELKE